MFNKLRKKITINFMTIFGIMLIAFSIGIIAFVVRIDLQSKGEMFQNFANYEMKEFVSEIGEVPIVDLENEMKNELGDYYSIYLIDGNDEVKISRFKKEGLKEKLLVKKESWPELGEAPKLVMIDNENLNVGEIYFASRSTQEAKNGDIYTLYLFQNQDEAYGFYLLLIKVVLAFLIIFFLITTSLGYYLAGKVIEPIEKSYLEQKRFVADASHELRTPITVLNLAMSNLKEEIPNLNNPTVKKIVGVIENELKKMNKLVSSLLVLARNNSKEVEIIKENYDLAKELRECILNLEQLAKQKNIEITENIQNEAMVIANKDEINQVLTILIDNAIKYSKENSKIEISLERNKSYLLKVKDHGVGIASENIEKVFNRFFREDKTRSTKGQGLGLSIAKMLVEKNEGSIAVKSKIDEGSEFTVKLPILKN